MKIIGVKELAFPEVKVIRYQRFPDHRGYFTETYRQEDFDTNPQTSFLKGVRFMQCNESYSKQGVVRGMHIQWNPFMGKLVRTIMGHMVDIVLDLRKNSPNYGCMIAYDMPAALDRDYGELIWVPIGFAHGNYYRADTKIEYFCTSQWNPQCETSISPLAADIDWSRCDETLKNEFMDISAKHPNLITDKDKNGHTISSWTASADSGNFTI